MPAIVCGKTLFHINATRQMAGCRVTYIGCDKEPGFDVRDREMCLWHEASAFRVGAGGEPPDVASPV